MNNKGITLIELTIVIGLLAILAGAVIFAVNPVQLLAEARNTERSAEVNTILNAMRQRMTDNRGVWDTTCGTATVSLPSATTTIGSDPGFINLERCLVTTYLPAMPLDPVVGVVANTGYAIIQQSNGRITVIASNAELGKDIAVTR
ncbi:MAG: type II secretion system protein [bacterium]|nr:type II secretion system protein [bacterium]